MKLRLTLAQKGICLVAIPFIFQLWFLLSYGTMLDRAEKLGEEEHHSKVLGARLNWAAALVSIEALCFLAFVLSHDKDYFNSYLACQKELKPDVEGMNDLVQDNAAQTSQLNDLKRSLFGLNKFMDSRLKNTDLIRNPAESSELTDAHMKEEWMKLARARRAMLDAELLRYHVSPDDLPLARKGMRQFITIAMFINIMITLLLAYYFNTRISNRVKVLTDNSFRLASGRELLPEIQGSDEIAQLDHDFHIMSSQLLEMSRRERAIIENAVDVICSIDTDGKFMAVSPSVQSWGYSQADLLGCRFVNVVEETWVDETLTVMNSARESKSPLSFENVLVRKDRSKLPVHWTGSWSDTDQAFFCVVHDMTERKKLEKLKDEFVAMITHDLRTPLTSVQIFHEMLGLELLGSLNEEGMRSLNQAESSISRLLNLVSDLLDYEKLKAGEMHLVLKQTCLSSIIAESINAVTPFAAKHKIRIDSADTDIELKGDAERLVRVLVNLLSNAVKFSPEGSTVKIGIEDRGSSVKVEIADSGSGIPTEDQSSIFEKYKQSGKSMKMQGTGLGLPICKAIIESHGGKIGVVSEPGKGSVFWFELPLT